MDYVLMAAAAAFAVWIATRGRGVTTENPRMKHNDGRYE
jgi:hypothetical protein